MTKRLLTSGSGDDAPAVKPADDATPEVPDAARTPDEAAEEGTDVVAPTAQRLLDAAVDTFAERGFHATTTRDIATRAGLSPAGLYVHYPSKAALLGHLSRVGHEAALRLVRHSLSLPGNSPRRLHALVASFVTWHAEHHTVARVVQYEFRSLTGGDREQVSAMRREVERLVEAEIRRGLAAGTLSTPHPRQATRAILSLAVDVARWFDPHGAETPRRLGMIYADLALTMLGADVVTAGPADDDRDDSTASSGRPAAGPPTDEYPPVTGLAPAGDSEPQDTHEE